MHAGNPSTAEIKDRQIPSVLTNGGPPSQREGVSDTCSHECADTQRRGREDTDHTILLVIFFSSHSIALISQCVTSYNKDRRGRRGKGRGLGGGRKKRKRRGRRRR